MIYRDNEDTFGELLVRFRKYKNLTQQQLATEVGVHRNAIGRWERGDVLPNSKRTILELIRVLQLDDAEGRYLLEASFTALAPLWNVPHRRNPLFTGRQHCLAAVHQFLASGQGNGLPQRSYAFSGLGGIGKTHAAVEYAYIHALEYSAVFWIDAETNETILSSFLALAEFLQLPQCHDSNQHLILAGVQRWLMQQPGWLMIWDNVADMDVLNHYLPASYQGAILVTTQTQVLGLGAQGIDLPLMEREEGVLFLLRRAKILSQQATIEHLSLFARQHLDEYVASQELVRQLGQLPLALDQAGAYIEETACGVIGYLQLYRAQLMRLLELRGTSTGGHPQSMASTLILTYTYVEQTNAAAAELLCLCAFLYPDGIPEELIVVGGEFLGPNLQRIARDPYQFDQAIAVLRTYSLVTRSPETRMLSIHRLVQDILKEYLDVSAVQQWSERIVQILNAVFPTGKLAEQWPICQRYLAHVDVCVHLIERQKLVSPEAGRLLHEAGSYLRRRALHIQAEHWLSLAYTIRQQIEGEKHSAVAATLNELAELSRRQGKYTDASIRFQQALEMRIQLLGAEHSDVAESLYGLAWVNWSWGQYKDAAFYFQRSLKIREQAFGDQHPEVAASLNGLAVVYWSLGQYKEAELLYRQALGILTQQLGDSHLSVASNLHNLALVCSTMGRYKEGERLYRRALSIQEQTLGSQHPDVAGSLHGLAQLYIQLEKYEEAERLYRRALSIREQVFGAEHPDVALSLYGLAQLYIQLEKYEEAERHYRRALSIREQAFGAEHPDVATCLNELASLYADQRRYEEAEPLFKCALTIREHVFGAEHPAVVETLNHLKRLDIYEKG